MEKNEKKLCYKSDAVAILKIDSNNSIEKNKKTLLLVREAAILKLDSNNSVG